MFKFYTNKQADRKNDLPAFIFKNKPLPPAARALLAARGITDEASARVYFDPCEDDLQDALLLKNITAAADRIRAAVKNSETVLIYGDYDADGICATAILYLYLKDIGANVIPHIPDRQDGYGLSVETVETLAEEYGPDLWITCDCGISNAAEAEYILDLGMDVIITDHHDLPELLPDCITVSPKLQGQGYSYPSLCGAGVALMLVRAMGGRDAARRFYDLAAIATIGDMVPLTGENRILTILGLKQLNAGPNLWIKMLAESAGAAFPLSSTDIAFKIVPRINAAGRMARAADAFDFIVSDHAFKAACLKKVEDAAAQRKAASDKIYAEALADLREEKLYDKYAIVLSSPEWEKGVTGIAAAQLANAFNRPVFLMSKASGGEYKGTARSIDGINIRGVLAAASAHLTEYGGHSAAAGFSLPEKNIPAFKAAVLKYLDENADKSLFSYRQEYDAEITEGEITLELARQLKMFEPFGTDNRPPLFMLKAEKASTAPMKNKPEHITVCTEKGVNLIGFNCRNLSDIFESCSRKELLLEIRLNSYMGKEELSVILKHSSCPVFKDDIDNEKIAVRYIERLTTPPASGSMRGHPSVEGNCASGQPLNGLETLIKDCLDKPYGLLVIASTYASYKAFADKYDPCGENFLHEYLYPTTLNNYNRLIIAPKPDAFALDFYHTVIYLDPPLPDAGEALSEKIDLSRETFGRYYRLLSDMNGTAARDIYALFQAAKQQNSAVNFLQFAVCLYVFAELKLAEYSENKPLKLLPGKAELTNSRLYCIIKDSVTVTNGKLIDKT